jgi:hypothetical protein
MAISLLRVPQPAKVAGFEGFGKDTREFAVTVTRPEPANVLPVQLSRPEASSASYMKRNQDFSR